MTMGLASNNKPLAVKRAVRNTGELITRVFRGLMKLVLVVVFVGGGLLIGGFLQFTNKVSGYSENKEITPASAIVALTGGSTRIATALELLAEKKGARLLISGVNATTKIIDIKQFNPTHEGLFDCCVDVERVAEDTIGNAVESAKWVKQNGYKSLIVVTSAYHMPRSLVEFHRQMPEVKLIPYAVPLESISEAGWWREPDTLRFMLSEYIKYVGTRVKDYIHPQTFDALRGSVTL